jgi:hypothetical protein
MRKFRIRILRPRPRPRRNDSARPDGHPRQLPLSQGHVEAQERPTPPAEVWIHAATTFVVALGARLWGIGFGLPDLLHPDEPAYVLQALALARGLPEGLTFANPPLYKYVLLGEYAVAYALARLTGASTSAESFVSQFRADPTELYLLARVSSAVFGALTALAALALGTAVGGRWVGIIAGWLTAVSLLLVRDAHFATNDALVTLLVTLGLVYCVRFARGGPAQNAVGAAALAGLAFAAKYDGIALLLPAVVAHLVCAGRRPRDLVLALAACAAVAVLAFPSLVTEPRRVAQDIYLHLYLGARDGYDGLDPDGGFVFYLKTLVIGVGWPLTLAALTGLALGLARRDRSWLVVGSLPLGMYVVLGASRMYFARFLLPALPALLVAAAVALDAAARLAIARLPAPLARGGRETAIGSIIVLAVASVAVGPTMADAVRFDFLMGLDDTRTLARAWVDASLPHGATIAVDAAPLGPTISAQRHTVLVANEWSLYDLTLADYQARGVEYLVTSTFTSKVRPIEPARDARRLEFYKHLTSTLVPIAEFRPYARDPEPWFTYDQLYAPFTNLDRLQRPGPTVRIYRLSDAPRTPP